MFSAKKYVRMYIRNKFTHSIYECRRVRIPKHAGFFKSGLQMRKTMYDAAAESEFQFQVGQSTWARLTAGRDVFSPRTFEDSLQFSCVIRLAKAA